MQRGRASSMTSTRSLRLRTARTSCTHLFLTVCLVLTAAVAAGATAKADEPIEVPGSRYEAGQEWALRKAASATLKRLDLRAPIYQRIEVLK